MSYDIGPEALDAELVFRFFWRFATLECALKREGFAAGDEGDPASVDWRRFAREIDGAFGRYGREGFAHALALLTFRAPKRQVMRKGRPVWEPVSSNARSQEELALRYVRTVRNNLFHGGKYPDGPVEEIERNRELMEAALVVVEACFDTCPALKRWDSAAA